MSGPGLVISGEIDDGPDQGSPALIQFDVIKFKDSMDVWTPALNTLFQESDTVPNTDLKDDESDVHYESDDEDIIDVRMGKKLMTVLRLQVVLSRLQKHPLKPKPWTERDPAVIYFIFTQAYYPPN